ncbi:hypothetical protein QE372_002640 [Agrobacterium pusense]|uniref:DUF4339 domain-containing protein n=1 Tax=Agrobacterium pusense TaxID=648995 RepID=UPI00286606C2|nr:DUF4339 domain-containing protein [Agrobacterium pusense]MDR6190372.1 hypothetical protein [Agrobacterium pusense]
MEWHYNLKGKRSGPVSFDALRELYANGDVFSDTLVWNTTFGSEWKRLDTVPELRSEDTAEPPPLPSSAISDRWIWIIALSPLALGFLDVWSQETTGKELGSGIYGIGSLIIWLTCVAMDNRLVTDAGSGKRIKGVAAWMCLSPLAYLFVRAKRLQKNQLPAISWVLSFIASIYLATGGLSSDIYLGSGLPACSAKSSIAQAKEIFPRLPANISGMTALSVNEVKDAGIANGKRTCTAKILAADGQSYGVSYTIEEKDGQLYYFLRPFG